MKRLGEVEGETLHSDWRHWGCAQRLSSLSVCPLPAGCVGHVDRSPCPQTDLQLLGRERSKTGTARGRVQNQWVRAAGAGGAGKNSSAIGVIWSRRQA